MNVADMLNSSQYYVLLEDTKANICLYVNESLQCFSAIFFSAANIILRRTITLFNFLLSLEIFTYVFVDFLSGKPLRLQDVNELQCKSRIVQERA